MHERLLSAMARMQVCWAEHRTTLSQPTGATAVEYAIMLAFIAAIIVTGVALLGRGTKAGFEKVVFP
jgi:Flp pilus assembly pilin Flp